MRKKDNYSTGLSSRLLFLLMLIFFGCGTSQITPDEINMGYEYFPLQTGDFIIYEISEIRYDGEDPAIFEYQIKESVIDSFINQEGEPTYLIRRYKRENDSLPWGNVIADTWKAVRTKTNVVVFENNIPYVKLTFPVKNGLTWDGNAFNTKGSLAYELSDVEQPYNMDSIEFENSATVIQSNFLSLVEKDSRKEIYVKNIGLVYREFIQLEYINNPDDPDYGKDIITGGLDLTMRMINYGKE